MCAKRANRCLGMAVFYLSVMAAFRPLVFLKVIMCYVTFHRIAITIHAVLDQSVTNSRWQLGAVLKTSSKDINLFKDMC